MAASDVGASSDDVPPAEEAPPDNETGPPDRIDARTASSNRRAAGESDSSGGADPWAGPPSGSHDRIPLVPTTIASNNGGESPGAPTLARIV
ncbi:MAG: hypothetical protein ACYTG0_33085 [Planctomycetota bacterium]